jgi:hypothetical protein
MEESMGGLLEGPVFSFPFRPISLFFLGLCLVLPFA